VSNLEFNRLQSSVIQQNLRDVGIALEVRTFEFATRPPTLSVQHSNVPLSGSAERVADPTCAPQRDADRRAGSCWNTDISLDRVPLAQWSPGNGRRRPDPVGGLIEQSGALCRIRA